MLLKFENGLTVFLKENNTCYSTFINFAILNGAYNQEGYTKGTAHMLEHNIFAGNKKYNKQCVTDLLLKMNTQIEALTYDYYTTYSIRTIKKNSLKALKLLHNFIFNALLDENYFIKEKKIIVEEYFKQLVNPFASNAISAFQLYYSKNIVDDGNGLGSLDDIKNISFLELKKFYQEKYTLNNTIITICGNFNKKNILNLMLKMYGKYKVVNSVQYNMELQSINIKKEQIIKFKNMKTKDCFFEILIQADNLLSDNCALFKLIEEFFNGYIIKSPIKQKLRDEMNFIYNLDCCYDGDLLNKNAGTISIRFRTQNKHAISALAETINVLKHLKNSIDEKKLKTLKEILKVNTLMRLENVKNRSFINIESLILRNQPFNAKKYFEEINKINIEIVNKFFENLFYNRFIIHCTSTKRTNKKLSKAFKSFQ